MRNAASSPTIMRAVPSEPARFFASTRVPDTRSARSSAVVTDAPSSVCSMPAATPATSSALVARTYTVFTRPARSETRLELRELHVDVRRLSAERRLGDADDVNSFPPRATESPRPRFSRARVALVRGSPRVRLRSGSTARGRTCPGVIAPSSFTVSSTPATLRGSSRRCSRAGRRRARAGRLSRSRAARSPRGRCLRCGSSSDVRPPAAAATPSTAAICVDLARRRTRAGPSRRTCPARSASPGSPRSRRPKRPPPFSSRSC